MSGAIVRGIGHDLFEQSIAIHFEGDDLIGTPILADSAGDMQHTDTTNGQWRDNTEPREFSEQPQGVGVNEGEKGRKS